MAQDFAQVFGFEFGDAADLREASRYGVEAVDVFAYLAKVGLFEGFAFEVVGPTAERRDGGSQLVGCFLGHTDPYAVFLFAACRAEKVVGDEQQHEGQEEVDERYDAQQLEHRRRLVIDVSCLVVRQFQRDGLVGVGHLVKFVAQFLGVVEIVRIDIARSENIAVGTVDDDDRDEDAVVGDFGKERAVEVVEDGTHIGVDLRLAVEEGQRDAPHGVMERGIVGKILQKLWRDFGADELPVLLGRGPYVATAGDDRVAVDNHKRGAAAVDDVGYVGEVELGVGTQVAVVKGLQHIDIEFDLAAFVDGHFVEEGLGRGHQLGLLADGTGPNAHLLLFRDAYLLCEGVDNPQCGHSKHERDGHYDPFALAWLFEFDRSFCFFASHS